MSRYVHISERSALYKRVRYQLSKENPDLVTLLVLMDKLPCDSKRAKELRGRIMELVNNR